jgi:hypothetical protein
MVESFRLAKHSLLEKFEIHSRIRHIFVLGLTLFLQQQSIIVPRVLVEAGGIEDLCFSSYQIS